MDAFHFPAAIVPLAAGMAALALLPLLIRSRGLPQDLPNQRSLHSRPVPRSGGIAIVAPVLIAAWLTAPELGATLACASLLMGLSFLDDLRPIPPVLRLLAHLLICGAWVYQTLPQLPAATSLLLVLGMVWLTNLYNFMDGSDGMAGGMSVTGFASYALIAAMHSQSSPLAPAIAVAAGSIAACGAAFLLFNFHPARIFMGDVGSIPLGFMAGALGVLGWQQGLWSPLLPLLCFLLFIADASLTLVKRVAVGEKFWLPHKNHYYQRVIQLGAGHARTAIGAYALMTGTAASAILLATLGASGPATASTLAVWLIVHGALAVAIDRRWRQAAPGAAP